VKDNLEKLPNVSAVVPMGRDVATAIGGNEFGTNPWSAIRSPLVAGATEIRAQFYSADEHPSRSAAEHAADDVGFFRNCVAVMGHDVGQHDGIGAGSLALRGARRHC